MDPVPGRASGPLIARWPGRIAAGTTNNRLTANYDFMPTLAALAAVPMPDGKDGLSWLPTIPANVKIWQSAIPKNSRV